jgi:ABC-type proline/glycine betaine transport system ATPase subunit
VLVTHDLREAFLLADQIVVLRRGRVEQTAASEELEANPGSAYVRDLLSRSQVRRL